MARVTREEMEKMKRLVDETGQLNKDSKDVEKVLTKNKNILKQFAQNNSRDEIQGDKFKAMFSPQTTSIIDPKKYFEFLKKEKKEKWFWETVKVSVESAKKYVAEQEMLDEGILEREVTEYHKITFK